MTHYFYMVLSFADVRYKTPQKETSMSNHSVRALAFHHEKGYEAQKELALKFAGTDGRIATMEDIVHARLHSSIEDFVWSRVFITDSRVYAGTNSGKPLLVFTHGNGPKPVTLGSLRRFAGSQYDHYRTSTDTRKNMVVEQEVFEDLLLGKYGTVSVVDLSTYKSTAVEGEQKASNRYMYEEARKDEIIRAFFGREADAFFDHYHQLTQDWLKDEPNAVRKNAIMFANMAFDMYDRYTEGHPTPVGYACAYPLTIQSDGLYIDRESKRHKSYEMIFSVSTNSGIDDLGGPAYYLVGIRGKEPITEVTPEFRTVVREIKEQWPTFVQPLAEVQNDAYVGVKPDGSRERPYYLPSKWGSVPRCTGRIREDGSESPIPEYRIKSMQRVDAPPTVKFTETPYDPHRGYPYPRMWDTAVRAMPEGANAISFSGSCHSGRTIEANTTFWHVELEKEPFRILMKCGDDFFTQYSDEKRPTHQPHRHIAKAVELKVKKGWRIPHEIYNMHESMHDEWPILGYLISKAPDGANAMWVERQSTGYQETVHKNVMHVTVHYYKVELGDKAFRPLTEIRADFDWQLERCKEANLLKAA